MEALVVSKEAWVDLDQSILYSIDYSYFGFAFYRVLVSESVGLFLVWLLYGLFMSLK